MVVVAIGVNATRRIDEEIQINETFCNRRQLSIVMFRVSMQKYNDDEDDNDVDDDDIVVVVVVDELTVPKKK